MFPNGLSPPRFQWHPLKTPPTQRKDALEAGGEAHADEAISHLCPSQAPDGPWQLLGGTSRSLSGWRGKALGLLLAWRTPGIPCFPGLGRGQSVGAVKAALAPHLPPRLANNRCAVNVC